MTTITNSLGAETSVLVQSLFVVGTSIELEFENSHIQATSLTFNPNLITKN